MELSEVYADAKRRVSFGEPLIELPAAKILSTPDGRFFVEVSVVVDALLNADGASVQHDEKT